MKFLRSAGILLHPTSLPGKYGIGELGKEAFNFIDFMKKTDQKLWQVFPLGPTGYGDSPYQCFSAFAGNPLLISIEKLIAENLLDIKDAEILTQCNQQQIDFGPLIHEKTNLLKKAFKNFLETIDKTHEEMNLFFSENKYWLDDFALFMAVKEFHGGILWTEWTKEIAQRDSNAVKVWSDKLSNEIAYQKFIQYKFYEQWNAVKKYAHDNEITIIGDLPIFIAYDSSDVWANKKLFTVDDNGKLETIAGVPPDYFSETGQLWGNPLYRWDEMKKDDFDWWRKRFQKMYELVDYVRIDHFRGFEAFYEIPGDAKTAIHGKWVKAPGMEFFTSLMNKLGDIPILAEDLGVITKGVRELRDHFNFPGMKILQFAFGKKGDKSFLPHNHIQNCVVYTGSHDNDTTKAFFEKEKFSNSDIYEWTKKYLNYNGEDLRMAVIKAAYASVSNMVVIPMQDILNLGGEARMNFPGRLGGNWTWRFTWNQLSENMILELQHLVEIYERIPKMKNIEE